MFCFELFEKNERVCKGYIKLINDANILRKKSRFNIQKFNGRSFEH